MSIHLPLDLLFVHSVLTTATFFQQDIIRRTEFFGRPTAPVPLQLSAALGGLVAIGTLIHFFVMTPWYWVFVLVALSSLIAVRGSIDLRGHCSHRAVVPCVAGLRHLGQHAHRETACMISRDLEYWVRSPHRSAFV